MVKNFQNQSVYTKRIILEELPGKSVFSNLWFFKICNNSYSDKYLNGVENVISIFIYCFTKSHFVLLEIEENLFCSK